MNTPPRSTLKEFQGFILRGNVVDLAVAVAIGAAFTAVITAFTKSFITPLVAALLPHRNGGAFASLNFAIGKTTFDVAGFITALITFVITAVIIFFFVVKDVFIDIIFSTFKIFIIFFVIIIYLL
jgi:large conductance mechanosensitive channel